jgi:hypothetical protein
VTCTPIPGGFICSRGPVARCSVSGCARAARYACDHPLTGARRATCDATLCGYHRAPQGDGRDFCPAHHRFARSQLALPGIGR